MTGSTRPPRYIGERNLQGWQLRCWALDHPGAYDFRAEDCVDKYLIEALSSTERAHPPSYELYRVGFVIAHSGRRGVSLSICHCGAWGDTGELFISQYFVDRTNSPELLENFDPGDPLISEYEIDVFSDECRLLRSRFGKAGLRPPENNSSARP